MSRLVVLFVALLLSACARGHLQPFPEIDDPALYERRFAVADLHADIDTLFDGIAARHPDLAARASADDLAAARIAARARVTAPMTRREFFRTVGDVTAVFRDGHAGLLYPYPEFDAHMGAGGRRFPLAVRRDGDGLVVDWDASTPARVPAGSRLLRINGLPVESLLDGLAPYARGETALLRREIIIESLGEWLWHRHDWADDFSVAYIDADREAEAHLDGVDAAAWLAATSAAGTGDELPRYEAFDATTGLLDVPYFGGDLDAFATALEAAHAAASAQQPRSLVVDLRRNPGGSTDAVELLLARLTDRPCALAASVHEKRNADNLRWWEARTRIGRVVVDDAVPVVQPADPADRFPGDLRVLVSAYTYSAAIVMATAVQDCHIGVLVGEETGGHANQTAQMHFFDLPHTRLRAFAPTRLVLRPSGDRRGGGVRPDHVVPTSAARLPRTGDAALRKASRADLPALAHPH
jgi:hypothetical protein